MRQAFYICIILICIGCLKECGEAYPQTLTASWYSAESCKREGTWQRYGGKMANGEVFDEEKLICASWDYDFGTRLLITNLKNGKRVVATVCDRGPNKKLYKEGRVIDLSKMAFSSIAELREGVIPISIEVVS